MKTYPLPALTLGLDVKSPESSMPAGAVRRATNIDILDDGTFRRRPGYAELATLSGAHSFWRSPVSTRALVAAGSTLYDVSLPDGGVAPLITGLPYEQPVSCDDVGTDIYVTSGGMLRKIALDGSVRRPGVANLLGDKPTLATTVGNLYPGRYGVAYSLINDLGEESGISSIEWVELATTGGILLSGIQTAPDVAKVALYVTTQNGGELFHHATRAYAATQSILDQTVGRLATRQYLQPMPGGNIVRYWRGHVIVVDGKWVWISPAMDYGVCDVKSGWTTFNRTITMCEPVEGGIFFGMRERTIFLRGDAPDKFEQVNAAKVGAFPNSSQRVKADFLGARLATSNLDHAVWMTDQGFAVGRPDGTITYPNSGRISVTGADTRPLFVQHGGIRQGIFCVDSLAIGADGAVDTTT